MPNIHFVLRSNNKDKVITVDTDRTLMDYYDEIMIAISEMTPELKSELEDHDLYFQNNKIDLNKKINELELLEDSIIEAKPWVENLKDDFELGFLLLSLVPEKYQNKLVGVEEPDDPEPIENRKNALGLAFECKDQKLDVDFIQLIHNTCKGNNYPEIKGGEFFDTRKAGAPFGFHFTNLSVKAYKDAIAFAKKYASFGIQAKIESDIIFNKKIKDNLLSDINNFKLFHTKLIVAYSSARSQFPEHYKEKPPIFFYSIDHTVLECNAVMSKIIENYQLKVQKAKSLNDDNLLLEAIIECHYEILMLHGFQDLNTRTSIILLNILLMQHNFPPSSIFQSGISKEELFSVIKKGMLQTFQLIEENNFNGEIPSQQYLDVIAKSKERISKLHDFPAPTWIVHFDSEKNAIQIGKGLTRLKMDNRLFSPIEKLRYSSSFKDTRSQSQTSLSTNSFESHGSLTPTISPSSASSFGSTFSPSISTSFASSSGSSPSDSRTPEGSHSPLMSTRAITPDDSTERTTSPEASITRSFSEETMSSHHKPRLFKNSNRNKEYRHTPEKNNCKLM